MATTWKRSLKHNKPLAITLAVISAIVALVIIAGAIYMITPMGKASYQTVAVPESSKELTKVPEAPIGRLDAPKDSHVGVDMLGNKVAPGVNSQAVTGDDNKAKERQNKNQNNNGNNQPAPAPAAQNIQERTEKMKQVSNTGERFVVPSIGLDVPLGAITMIDNMVEPTNYTSVFQIRNMGVPYDKANKGTVYIATHALDVKPEGNPLSYTPGGLAPGNFFMDTRTGEPRVNPGDKIKVGNKNFEITGTKRIGKGVITQDADIWNEKIPNRMVILLCQPDSNDNRVVFAKPIP